MLVISDTSPLSNLIIIDHLFVLEELYKEVIIPPAVSQEILALEKLGFSLTKFHQARWIKTHSPQNKTEVKELQRELDEGESEAIVLAEEIGAKVLLIDERLGWKHAQSRGLKTVGLLGVLLKDKE